MASPCRYSGRRASGQVFTPGKRQARCQRYQAVQSVVLGESSISLTPKKLPRLSWTFAAALSSTAAPSLRTPYCERRRSRACGCGLWNSQGFRCRYGSTVGQPQHDLSRAAKSTPHSLGTLIRLNTPVRTRRPAYPSGASPYTGGSKVLEILKK